jgi:non-specific serine/threonine protein kinase
LKPERWKQIEKVYYAASKLEVSRRAAFLDQACAGDEALRREVASLLASDAQAGSFLARPAAEVIAKVIDPEIQPSPIGRQIGHYQLQSLLGAGGMGEIYLAQDTRLGRMVAIKLLPIEFTADAGRVRRFAREARTASALNHPNIITIHEIGEIESTHYIVSEYVAGETLRQRMMDAPQQQMTASETLDIAVQIASALAAAHEAGITHRDMKPENVMVRPDGYVKVLDFGLAKLTEVASPITDSQYPTLMTNSTEAGMVMGTPRYMSPEQARGEEVDARTDIFSLGVMLYEMIAGCAPFVGAATNETIAAILRDEPLPLRRHTPAAGGELEHIVSQALRKERANRYQTAGDLLTDLKKLKQRIELQTKLGNFDGNSQPRVLSFTSGNLPQPLTSFIGREREMAELKQLLSTVRLLTLTGVAGTGKTRLSLQVAAEVSDRFSDGVWLVELAPLSDPGLVTQLIASSLGVPESNRPLLVTLSDYLKTKSVLLVIDNCEHLLLACAQAVENLLQSCSKLCIIATSREALEIAGEMIYSVPTLSLPDPIGDLTAAASLADLTRSEAARLFLDRAAFSQPPFVVTKQNAFAIAQICRRLDGIPLAIELAAARVKALSPEQIWHRLDDRFQLLTGGNRTALPRQQTLRAMVDWSNDLLSERERRLWWRFSVFAGGWTLEAAESVCAGNGLQKDEILDLLSHLVGKSLVNPKPDASGTVRYYLLETMRQYGREKLAETDDCAWLRAQHLRYFTCLAEQAEPHLFIAAQSWLEVVEQEHDNLREALEWGLGFHGGTPLALRLAGALFMFWFVRCFLNEGRQWLEAALKCSEGAEPTVRAKLLAGASRLTFNQGDHRRSVALSEECLVLEPQSEMLWPMVIARVSLGACYQYYLGDVRRALDYLERAVALSQQCGQKWLLGLSLVNCGEAAQAYGQTERARSLFEEGLALATEVGDRWVAALSLGNLACQALLMGHLEQAGAHFAKSILIRQELKDKRGLAACLEEMAILAQLAGESGRAARLFGAAEVQRDTIGASLTFVLTRTYCEKSIGAVRAVLGEASFAVYRREGFAMALDQAIAYALEPLGGANRQGSA